MSKKRRNISIIVFVIVIALLIVGIVATGGHSHHGDIKETMRDAVLHEAFQVRVLGMTVNPGLISAYCVTLIFLIFTLIVRFFVIPRFSMEKPGKFQTLLEEAVGLFDRMAKQNSPHHNQFLGGYLFTAGSYIFIGTLFELFGFQVITTRGISISLPAPLSDVNAAIAMGFLSFGVILSGGFIGNRFKGVAGALKDFSLPISMSFRIFGALLSGALVTELVYHYLALSFILPIIVGVMFTLLHALIQTYVLTMLTALFYGEACEPPEKKGESKK